MKFNTSLLADAPLVPVVYARILARLACQNVDIRARMLAECQLDEATLDNPEAYISIRQYFRLMDVSQEHSQHEALGIRYGMELDLSAHGLQAFSLLNVQNPAHLTCKAIQFLNARSPLMGLSIASHGPYAIISLEDIWPLGRARQFLIETYLGSLCRIASSMTRCHQVHLELRAPHLQSTFEQLLGCEVRFGAKQNAVMVARPQSTLSAQLPSHLPAKRHHTATGMQIVTRIRRRIEQSPGRNCTLDRIAESLGSTSRTISRHLRDAGIQFSDLRNEVRERLARQYLSEGRLSIADIAEKLGYSDQASFTKAFRTWTGTSPGRARRLSETESI
ncbi:MAG: AraC family transcriptional regulator [Alcanivorax sp.]|nr:AraC family transcriptional regulator [Alcanivorax sp.]